ncbi:MAG TPA: hypothetical protein PLV41_02805, partial [Miltoncostaeales bacterium]|nr:hypothetical protein [Miltoncostaeales bacterium]
HPRPCGSEVCSPKVAGTDPRQAANPDADHLEAVDEGPELPALVVGLARTPEQAGLAQSMVALVLGILGGAFFSMARAGAFGRIATTFTPHYWFSEGLIRLTDGGSWTAAVEPAAILLLFTAVVGVPGVLVARRSVRP